ncbi:hypothetical protein ILUMI_27002 [Ignelater luminosus]|uniref:Uncharacterized protein n=1 Tax=Ignelater luminosus TaxID=2038154 RepID=A0A8K0C3C9_IGNLU|nr:hypothetical protein ILUMI_27002 [Ignelater luminosus]
MTFYWPQPHPDPRQYPQLKKSPVDTTGALFLLHLEPVFVLCLSHSFGIVDSFAMEPSSSVFERIYSCGCVKLQSQASRLLEEITTPVQHVRASTERLIKSRLNHNNEYTEVSTTEKTRIDDQIGNLNKSKSVIEGKEVEVSHNLVFAMVDGKVCNALTNTTLTQKCYVCGATSKNDYEGIILKT